MVGRTTRMCEEGTEVVPAIKFIIIIHFYLSIYTYNILKYIIAYYIYIDMNWLT